MIWLPRTTDSSTHFAQSLEFRGIESRLYFERRNDCYALLAINKANYILNRLFSCSYIDLIYGKIKKKNGKKSHF